MRMVTTPSGARIPYTHRATHPEWGRTVTRLIRGETTLNQEARAWGTTANALRCAFKRSVGKAYSDTVRDAAWSYYTDSRGQRAVVHYGEPVCLIHDAGTNGYVLEVLFYSPCDDENRKREVVATGKAMWIMAHALKGGVLCPLTEVVNGGAGV